MSGIPSAERISESASDWLWERVNEQREDIFADLIQDMIAADLPFALRNKIEETIMAFVCETGEIAFALGVNVGAGGWRALIFDAARGELRE